jgi:hypothetical protein
MKHLVVATSALFLCSLVLVSAQELSPSGIIIANGTAVMGVIPTSTCAFYSYSSLTFPAGDFPIVVALKQLAGSLTLFASNPGFQPIPGFSCSGTCRLSLPTTGNTAYSAAWSFSIYNTGLQDAQFRLSVKEYNDEAGTITVTQPAHGDVWMVNSIANISWTTSNVSDSYTVRIQLQPSSSSSMDCMTTRSITLATGYSGTTYSVNVSSLDPNAISKCAVWRIALAVEQSYLLTTYGDSFRIASPLVWQQPTAGMILSHVPVEPLAFIYFVCVCVCVCAVSSCCPWRRCEFDRSSNG